MSMMDFFDDWEKATAAFYTETTTNNSSGVPIQSASLVGSATVGKWVDQAVVTSSNDKFVGQEIGRMVLEPPSFTIDTTCYALINGIKYYITGVDDVALFGEVMVLGYRRER